MDLKLPCKDCKKPVLWKHERCYTCNEEYKKQPKEVITHCKSCHKKLPPIGDKRKNGKAGLQDWAQRGYHKSCWNNL